MQDIYTLADLTRVTGVKRRTVQLWAEAGAIEALVESEHAGTGVHRKFYREEAIVACILAPLSRLKVSIGKLVEFGEALRDIVWDQEYSPRLEACIAGKTGMFLFCSVPFSEEEGMEVWISEPEEKDEAAEIIQMLGHDLFFKPAHRSVTLTFGLHDWLMPLR